MSFIAGLFGSNAENLNSGFNSEDQRVSLQHVDQAVQQQQAFANQVGAIANGQGPNLAQAQLDQATNQNTQQANALIHSQKGISPALAARLGAQMGASNNQQAAGQSATVRAQQQMAALGLQGQALNAATQGRQGIYNAQAQEAQSRNQTAQQNAQNNGGIAGGILGAAGSLIGLAHGGTVPAYAEGGAVAPADPKKPQSGLGDFFKAIGTGVSTGSAGNKLGYGVSGFGVGLGKALGNIFAPSPLAIQDSTQMAGEPMSAPPVAQPSMMPSAPSEPQMMAAHGGKVPIKVSPEELIIPPQQAKAVAEGKADATKVAKRVPGKAKVKGDSYANDTVNAAEAPGSIIVPRSISTGDDVAEKAQAFVAAMIAHHKHGSKKGK